MDGVSYVLISKLQGHQSHQMLEDVSVPVAIECLAEALKRIHSVPVENCPFDHVVENDLEESAHRVGLLGLACDAKADEALIQRVQNSIPVTQLPGYLNCNHA